LNEIGKGIICTPGTQVIAQPGNSVTGVLDEPYSQLTPLSGVAVEARQSMYLNRVQWTLSILCIAWRAGMATLLSGLS
jgi:hypothetical protein